MEDEVNEATENDEDLLPVVAVDEVEAKEDAEAFDEDLWWPELTSLPLLV